MGATQESDTCPFPATSANAVGDCGAVMGMVVVVVVVVVVGGIVVVVVVVVVVGTVVDVVDPAATKVVEVVAVGEATGVRDGSTISLGRDSLGVVTVVTSRNSVVGGAVGCGVPSGARGRGPGVEVVLDAALVSALPGELSLLLLRTNPTSPIDEIPTPTITSVLTCVNNDVRLFMAPRITKLYRQYSHRALPLVKQEFAVFTGDYGVRTAWPVAK